MSVSEYKRNAPQIDGAEIISQKPPFYWDLSRPLNFSFPWQFGNHWPNGKLTSVPKKIIHQFHFAYAFTLLINDIKFRVFLTKSKVNLDSKCSRKCNNLKGKKVLILKVSECKIQQNQSTYRNSGKKNLHFLKQHFHRTNSFRL